jgi:hypothetical protein
MSDKMDVRTMILEQAIKHAEEVANDYEEMTHDYTLDSEKLAKCAAEHRLLAAWLRELAERRKIDSCKGCKNIGLWENEYENGLNCPCLRCARRAKDNYEPERRENND